MLTTFRKYVAVLALASLPLTALAAAAKADEAIAVAIKQQLQSYEQALNKSDIDAVVKLYAEDSVFMPQNSPAAVGRDAVRTAYRHVFDAIKLDIRFEIDEIRPLSNDWAYARTHSTGTLKLLAGDKAQLPEANQELFILRRGEDGQWRFARYIFSATNPPATR